MRFHRKAAVGLLVLTVIASSSAFAGDGSVKTIAGNGRSGFSGDGGAATSAQLSFPIRAIMAPDGSILIADESSNVVRQVRADGRIATLAGTAGGGGFGGDGGAATSARLNQPTGVGPLPNGGFLIADRSNNRIRMVSAAGVITTVAGTGATCGNPAGACGDGGPATAAQLNGPDRAVALADGSFLITEDQGHKVRLVSANGTINRVAGTGVACASATSACGDGGAATSARLNAPNGIDVMPGGGFVISDSNDNRIRMVAANGTITTIAGNGVAGSYGDGINATNANLNAPSSVSVAPNGAVVIADTNSHLVRVVSKGKITTLAGIADHPCPVSTYGCGDGGPGSKARFNTPYDVSATPDGLVLVADHLDQRVRLIDASLGGAPTLKVVGRRIVNGAGQPVQLRGINRAIFESRCIYDANGDADGPQSAGSVTPMTDWKIDVVRVSFNEDCWLGINGLSASGNAGRYRNEVKDYVKLLRDNGLYVILESHVSGPGTNKSTLIDYMPDADHAPALWRSVAAAFKSDHGIVFDPINEVAMASYNDPHPVPAGQWACWRNGCTLDTMYGGRFKAAGIQTLLNAIRDQGATQPVIVGGIGYNGDLTQLLDYLPTDQQRQLIASTHVYDFTAGNTIDATMTNVLEPIAAKIPVIFGELGERYCDSGTASYTKHVLSLIDGEQAKGNIFGALGWTWNAKTDVSTGWHCPTGRYGDGGPLLISTYNGKPTIMGAAIRSWILSKSGNP